MLSNAHFLAKFRFDTAENEPAKNLQNFANFPNFANPKMLDLRELRPGGHDERVVLAELPLAEGLAELLRVLVLRALDVRPRLVELRLPDLEHPDRSDEAFLVRYEVLCLF